MQAPNEILQVLLGECTDRRRFLKGSVSGIALLGLGAWLPIGCKSYPKPQVPLRFFNSREYAIMNTVAERLLNADGRIGPGTQQIDVAANVDAVVAGWDADAQRQLRTILRLFEHGTYLFDLRRKRFTHLSTAQQDRYLEGWMTSTLGARRIVFRTLKCLAAIGFYRDPRTWRRLGYDGPWLGRVYVAPRVQPEPAVSRSALPLTDK
jgi:gluconate 2-dehydrogenase subunit 3-like protein